MSNARKHLRRLSPLRVGDEVIWYQKGHGKLKIRHGVVVMMVPRGCRPNLIMPSCGGTRAADSYVVKDAAERLLWPPAVDLLYMCQFYCKDKYRFGWKRT